MLDTVARREMVEPLAARHLRHVGTSRSREAAVGKLRSIEGLPPRAVTRRIACQRAGRVLRFRFAPQRDMQPVPSLREQLWALRASADARPPRRSRSFPPDAHASVGARVGRAWCRTPAEAANVRTLRTLAETSWLSPCVGGSFAARRGPGSDAPRSAGPEYAPCRNRRVPLASTNLTTLYRSLSLPRNRSARFPHEFRDSHVSGELVTTRPEVLPQPPCMPADSRRYARRWSFWN